MVQVLDKSRFKEMPWKNGGGTTTELIRFDSGVDLTLRLSVADVRQDGPFSLFPGLKRILYLLSGKNMTLNFPDQTIILTRPFEYFEFDGDISVNCHVKGACCRDFNIIFNPQHWSVISHQYTAVKAKHPIRINDSSHTQLGFLVNELKLIYLEPGQVFEYVPESDENLIQMTLAKI